MQLFFYDPAFYEQPHGHTLATGVAVPEFGVDSDTMGDGISADGSRMYAARNFLHGVLEGTKWPGATRE